MTANTGKLAIGLEDDTAALRTVVMCTPWAQGSISHATLNAVVEEQEALQAAKLAHQPGPSFHNRISAPDTLSMQRYLDQHRGFVERLTNWGVDVIQADPVQGCIGQAYIRDIAFAVADTVFVARPDRSDRVREQAGLDRLLSQCTNVVRIETGCIEGGDVMVLPRWILVGIGAQTDVTGLRALEAALHARGIERRVMPLEIAMTGVLHLDCVFNPIAPDVALVFPPALGSDSLRWLQKHFDLIALTLEEVSALQINTLNLDSRTVIVAPGSERLMHELSKRRFASYTVPYDEVQKGWGSFRCTTLPLHRGGA